MYSIQKENTAKTLSFMSNLASIIPVASSILANRHTSSGKPSESKVYPQTIYDMTHQTESFLQNNLFLSLNEKYL